MPPLKLNEDSKPQTSDSGKKKIALPLFGKKRTFGLGKTTSTSNPIKPKVAKIEISHIEPNDAVEEFDDEEDDKKISSKAPKSNDVTPASDSVSKPETLDAVKETEKPVATSDNVLKAASPPPLKQDSQLKSLEPTSEVQNSPTEVQNTEQFNMEIESRTTSKRKRNRTRIRGDKNRDNIDIDDAEEVADSDKYSKWVPPENQSGDGITDLNSKFGY